MTTLKKVKLGDIRPNPFRGDILLDEKKVVAIQASYDKQGFWDGYLIARRKDGYEAAFGHHRLEAAKQKWGAAHEILLCEQQLSDEDMLVMLANENDEAYGNRFYQSVIVPLKAVIHHLGDVATPLKAAIFLGWTMADARSPTGYQPSRAVQIAYAAIGLIDSKVLTANQFQPLTQAGAKTLVDLTRARMKAEQADIDNNVSVKQAALEQAQKDGNSNRVLVLEEQIDELEKGADKQVKKAAKSAATAVVQSLATGKPASEVVREIRGHMDPDSTATKAVKSDTQTAYDWIAKLEALGLDSDPKMAKVKGASEKARAELKAALHDAGRRLINRAKEL